MDHNDQCKKRATLPGLHDSILQHMLAAAYRCSVGYPTSWQETAQRRFLGQCKGSTAPSVQQMPSASVPTASWTMPLTALMEQTEEEDKN